MPLQMNAVRELIRYGVVGVANNAFGYMLYLTGTWLGLEPKTAVTVLYPIGATFAYFSHARYSFSYEGTVLRGVLRYIIAHAIGFGVNIFLLYIFYDLMKFPHQFVQALAICLVAGILFVLFKFFVFADVASKRGESC